jgi:putative hydrolase of the HAD superfamily
MSYELLLFDADETLFDFKKSQEVALKKSVSMYSITCPYEALKPIYEDINKGLWSDFEKGQITVDRLKVERFERLFEAISAPVDAMAFSKTYQENLGQASYIYSGVEALLQRLTKAYKLAIITNGLYAVQSVRIAESAVGSYFDEIVISEAVQLVKPDPEIFELTLYKLGHENKKTVLMVGDNLKSDILGGINAGIDTCWLNPDQKENKTDIIPTYELTSVLEIEALLSNKK